ncbi:MULTISPECIES: CheR family methyltransferase [unclassified Corallococcus]|uniref:CheR family methyltransferase n=1 Tax=unclassified Corallococcus TaxID=2685029 RepID=UPI001A8C393E|nr:MULTISPECIES: protein-glutamate O-methyltransferase CheR [unclassified Corallococcus]MBN9684462.1 protein-glutamate O-methyltransferase CheR [Corallococcus sp. NCSPR001]WAS84061.1 protein-glutamate O-methyltransferase CheR [Corallococcus sp. NCRR]
MSLLPDDFAYLRQRVLRRSGLVLEPDTSALVETRLTPLMREERLPDLSALVARLRSQPEGSPLHQRLAEALANHETAFFRDAPVFEALRTTVLPGLLARRARTRTLRIWCAACAYGQEPYSIAMTLAEAGLLITGWTVRILATDFSTRAIVRACEARYDAKEIHRGLTPELRQRYFRQERDGWRLNEHVRRPVEFRPLNLMDDFPLEAPVDLVFLRNVMIYWDVPTRRAVLARVRRMLHADSYLVLGAAEASPLMEDGFTRHLMGQTSWYRPTPASQGVGAAVEEARRSPRSGATP